MQRSGDGKLFTAELQRRRKQDSTEAATIGMTDMVLALRALQAEVAHLSFEIKTRPAPPPLPAAEAAPDPPPAQDPAVQAELEKHERDLAEVRVLKIELNALAHSIETTKKEIALLRAESREGDRLSTVANELDAVVAATEGATDTILDTVERIASLASQIQAQEQDSYLRHIADEIQEHTVTVFEACNFQDLTGQRITKVVNTMKFIEKRVDRMMEIWGRDSFADLPVDPAEEEHGHKDADARLLNGPQDVGKGISQDEIDRLFD